jgi:hypothetical protein
MYFQPASNAGHRAFVCVRVGVRAVENPYFTEQKHTNPRPLSFTDFGPELYKQRLNVSPVDVGGCRAREECF